MVALEHEPRAALRAVFLALHKRLNLVFKDLSLQGTKDLLGLRKAQAEVLQPLAVFLQHRQLDDFLLALLFVFGHELQPESQPLHLPSLLRPCLVLGRRLDHRALQYPPDAGSVDRERAGDPELAHSSFVHLLGTETFYAPMCPGILLLSMLRSKRRGLATIVLHITHPAVAICKMNARGSSPTFQSEP